MFNDDSKLTAEIYVFITRAAATTRTGMHVHAHTALVHMPRLSVICGADTCTLLYSSSLHPGSVLEREMLILVLSGKVLHTQRERERDIYLYIYRYIEREREEKRQKE